MANLEKLRKPKEHMEMLTFNEGSLVGLVKRQQPVTAYQLYKIYERSPVSSFNASKGSLYPLINRLKKRGLLAAKSVVGDKRHTELLTCTQAGIEAVTAWVKAIQTSDILLDDPLRTKLLSLYLLSKEDQIKWIVDAKTEVSKKIKIVKAYNLSATMPFQEFTYSSAILALEAKMKWLDELLYHIVNGSD